MKKTILAFALVIAMMTTVFAADGGSMYVGLHPQIQLPSLKLQGKLLKPTKTSSKN